MRSNDVMMKAWQSGMFLGSTRATGRFTVEPDWDIHEDSPGQQPARRQPCRWWQRLDNAQVEMEFPAHNIETITIDRNISQDTGQITIEVTNNKMSGTSIKGEPGYYLYHHGSSALERQRWGVTPNEWQDVLRPGCLIRTYQGYGGSDTDIRTAQAAGQIMLTGAWIIDDVVPTGVGGMTLTGRDMAALVVDQQLYPPLIPKRCYPLRYLRTQSKQPAHTSPYPGARSGVTNPPFIDSDLSALGYRDYSDIVKDLLRWSGFELFGSGNDIYGNIEDTGIYSDGALTEDFFDKNAVMDIINQLKEIVGFLAFVDDEGGFNFRSPNWWSKGNFLQDGSPTEFMPEIDESVTLVEYEVTVTRKNERSLTIIGSTDPALDIPGTIAVEDRTFFARIASHAPSFIRAQNIPMMMGTPVNITEKDQKTMAQLAALHIYFARRSGNVTMVANPCIGIDDQVRIWERATGECFIHYIQGSSTKFDRKAGTYTQTLETNWLGSTDDWSWAVDVDGGPRAGAAAVSRPLAALVSGYRAGSVFSGGGSAVQPPPPNQTITGDNSV